MSTTDLVRDALRDDWTGGTPSDGHRSVVVRVSKHTQVLGSSLGVELSHDGLGLVTQWPKPQWPHQPHHKQVRLTSRQVVDCH